MTAHSNILPGESNEQRSVVGYSLCGRKESDTTEHLTLSLSFYFIVVGDTLGN